MIFLKICLAIIIAISVRILEKVYTGEVPIDINNYDCSKYSDYISEEKFISIVKGIFISVYVFKIIVLLITIFIL